jgi:hypothetical protein
LSWPACVTGANRRIDGSRFVIDYPLLITPFRVQFGEALRVDGACYDATYVGTQSFFRRSF